MPNCRNRSEKTDETAAATTPRGAMTARNILSRRFSSVRKVDTSTESGRPITIRISTKIAARQPKRLGEAAGFGIGLDQRSQRRSLLVRRRDLREVGVDESERREAARRESLLELADGDLVEIIKGRRSGRAPNVPPAGARRRRRRPGTG